MGHRPDYVPAVDWIRIKFRSCAEVSAAGICSGVGFSYRRREERAIGGLGPHRGSSRALDLHWLHPCAASSDVFLSVPSRAFRDVKDGRNGEALVDTCVAAHISDMG